MLDQMKSKVLALQIAAITMVTPSLRSQRGQGSAEYVGVIIVAALLVLGLVTAAATWGPALVTKVGEFIDRLTGTALPA